MGKTSKLQRYFLLTLKHEGKNRVLRLLLQVHQVQIHHTLSINRNFQLQAFHFFPLVKLNQSCSSHCRDPCLLTDMLQQQDMVHVTEALEKQPP